MGITLQSAYLLIIREEGAEAGAESEFTLIEEDECAGSSQKACSKTIERVQYLIRRNSLDDNFTGSNRPKAVAAALEDKPRLIFFSSGPAAITRRPLALIPAIPSHVRTESCSDANHQLVFF
jgi:hypothetical protein